MSSSIQYLKGVGPVRVRQLAKIGIYSVADLVHHYPREYHVRAQVPISALPEAIGKTVMVRGKIVDTPREQRRQVKMLTATIADETGYVRLTWFNQGYLKAKLHPGLELTVAGKYSGEYKNIVVEEFSLSGPLPEIQPQYSLTEGLSNSVLTNIIQSGIREYREAEMFPEDFCARHKLLKGHDALIKLHFPQTLAEIGAAQYSIKFRELFLYQLSFLFWRRIRQQTRGYQHRPWPKLVSTLEEEYGFQFTPDQAQAIAEIEADLLRPLPMNRLLQGDVGSGKTAVASHALFTSALNGYKAVLMVPTEIVASQHFTTLKGAAEKLNLPVYLLTGSTKKKERDLILSELASPGGMILVGTHAVFQDKVNIDKLALVITDEQHRFGVQQRFSLAEKGDNPHVLVMSATPIPRTLAMTVYGDLDVSTLGNKPGGRKLIKTYVVHSSKRQKVFDFISKEMSQGNVGYIVCPLIEESEKISALSLEKYQDVLARGLPHSIYGVLHGRMSGPEKEAVVSALRNQEIQFLLATTVVEVGVDVGNATFIVIENSERFGLAQLHQLRGRVGRREKQSYCFLLTEGDEIERLKILEQSNDGLAVAMADLQLRGSGQFLGQRQHGLNEFRLADIVKDGEIAKLSRNAAQEVVEYIGTEPVWQHTYTAVMKNITNLKS